MEGLYHCTQYVHHDIDYAGKIRKTVVSVEFREYEEEEITFFISNSRWLERIEIITGVS